MTITKQQKDELLKQYVADLTGAGSAYVINQNAIPVNVSTAIRKDLKGTGAKFNVLRKRLFLKAVKQAGFDEVDLNDLQGSIVAVYAQSTEDFSPLKVINKYLKDFKANDKASSFSFLGARVDKKRKDSAYVTELANIPSKEELLSKLLYLLKYPVQSFACVLDQMAKKSS